MYVIVMSRDWPVTLLTAGVLMLLAALAFKRSEPSSRGSNELGRVSGVLLVTIYTTYMGILIFYPDFAL